MLRNENGTVEKKGSIKTNKQRADLWELSWKNKPNIGH